MRKPGCLAATVIGILVLVAVFVIGLRAGFGVLTEGKDYDKERAAAEAAGIHTHMAAFARPLPPPAQNAAPLYTEMARHRADKAFTQADKDALALLKPTLPVPTDYALSRRGLAAHPEPLRLAHRAALRPQCVFVRDWANPDPNKILFPEYVSLRDATRRLTMESFLLVHDGHPLQAVKNETLGFTFARHADSDSVLISSLVSIACDAITQGGLRKILYLTNGDPQTAAQVEKSMAAEWHPHALTPAVRAEIAYGQTLLDYLRLHPQAITELDSSNKSLKSYASSFPGRGLWLDTDGLHLLRKQREILGLIDLPYPQAIPKIRAIANAVREDTSPLHLISQMAFPDYVTLCERKARMTAWAEVTCTSAALLVWKAKHGAFPATLAEALPSVPADPFDGKPLRYRREGTGFVLYSIGTTGKFDGGTPAKKPNTREAIFRWPTPLYLRP